MKNLIVKTAVKTFLIILAVAVVAFGIFNFACPQHMATFAEQVGNYGMAVRYASLRYTYTGDTRDLARCFEDAILAEDDSSVVRYGDEFFRKDDCAQVMYELTAESVDETTGRYVDYLSLFGGSLVKSRYATGNFEGALSLALDLNGGTDSFEYGCPLMSLTAAVYGGQDRENASALLEALRGLSPSDEEQKQLLEQLIKSVTTLTL